MDKEMVDSVKRLIVEIQKKKHANLNVLIEIYFYSKRVLCGM